MKIGTRSLLFGAHQFLLHPIALFRAWYSLYGFPYDPRLWIAFIVHDWGYWGKPNMDKAEGETHPELGAKIMGFLFGLDWAMFTIAHSRFYAEHHGLNVSRLFVADKLATAALPKRLYLALVNLSGEIKEYKAATKYGSDYNVNPEISDDAWYEELTMYLRRFAAQKDSALTVADYAALGSR